MLPIKSATLKRLAPPEKIQDLSSVDEIFGTASYLEDVRLRGGLGFCERVAKYATTDQGRPLTMHNWFREYLRLIGDLRIGQVYTTGAAQTGKTMGHVLAFSDLIIHGRLDVGWAYASKNALIKYQKQQIRPVIENWAVAVELAHNVRIRNPNDVIGMELLQVGGVNANFSFASTSVETARSDGKSIVSGSGASYSAAILFGDERSRWPNGVDLSARLGYSPIPTTPMRDLGTPGGGQGIEKLMMGVDHSFYPHYRCSLESCPVSRAWAPLDPRGCLLVAKRSRNAYGREVSSFFTEDDRPADWWRSDESDPIGTAMICCSECGTEIGLKQRTVEAEFRCTMTGLRLDDYLLELPQNYDGYHRVSVFLSPLCRDNSAHLAVSLIRKGMGADDPRVWQQEDLGIPSSTKMSRLTDEALRPLIGMATMPSDVKPWQVVAGLDFGRDKVWLWVNALHLPPGWERLDHRQIRREAIRNVVFAEGIHRDRVIEVCKNLGVTAGLVDSEPDTTWSAWLCDQMPAFEMVDQVAIADDYRRGTVRTGGDVYPCWKINNPKWHWDVLRNVMAFDAFDNRPSYRFPESWKKWLNLPSADSPLRHIKGPQFNAAEEKWVRPGDKTDDLFYAALFAEAALAIALDDGGDGTEQLIDW